MSYYRVIFAGLVEHEGHAIPLRWDVLSEHGRYWHRLHATRPGYHALGFGDFEHGEILGSMLSLDFRWDSYDDHKWRIWGALAEFIGGRLRMLCAAATAQWGDVDALRRRASRI